MYTRKMIAGILTVVFAMMLLTACGAKPAATEPAAEPVQETAAQLVNPISEVTPDEMVQKTGVALDAPDDGENVHYFVISGEPALAQVTFDLSGKAYTYRAAATQMDATALSGIYFGSPAESAVPVAYMEGRLLSEGKTAVLCWEDMVPGISYTLSCTECEDPAALQEVAEQIFVPAQGDSDADGMDTPDMTGTYTDGNYDDVTLTEAEGGGFTAVVGIYRLSTFEGTGVWNEGTMELTLLDPNGEKLYATFTPVGDGTCTLTFTHSTWSLLETGTVFEGFCKSALSN